MRYHLELTGYVGAENFNSKKTDSLLSQYPGKHVDVLIDSTGGSLAHGLSIAGAFRNHGDVSAHMRGMCASAATIAAMGAKHITIEPDAFFLVHKVMMFFFEWSTHNADSLEQYIEALKAQKKDLETLDSSVAASYAARCKKPVNQLLDLMKEGKWLTAEQALEWGFVDEINESNQSKDLKLTKAQADAFAAQGLPIPPLEIENDAEQSSFLTELKKLFKSHFSMNQDPKHQEPKAQESPTQEPANTAQQPIASESDPKDAEIESLKAKNAELQAKLDAFNKKPAEQSPSVVSTPDPKEPEPQNDIKDLLNTGRTAADLFNSLP